MLLLDYFKGGFLLLLFSLSTLLLPAQCPQIIWADEFSGNALDQNNWNYQTGDGCAEGICGWGNNELQSYQEANVEVSNGTLKITARRQRIRGKQYTSGRINTKNKQDFTYGRYEARIKLPYGDGLWPAFWMLSTTEPYGGWPQSGEIDIMEFVASNPDEIFGTIHYGDPYPNNQFQGNNIKLENGNFPDDFHEFALEWEPGEIRWFLDGELYSRKVTADVAPYNWPFDHDFHFLLNVAVGGNLGGTVNNSMLPATMEVDYVRVLDGFKPYLSGDKIVANQESGVSYSVESVANNTNVTWSVPAGASIVSGQGSPNIVVDFGDASGTVSATFNDGCSSQTLDISVLVESAFAKAFSFENFDDPATISLNSATGNLTEISNPSPDAVNASSLVGEYIRNSGEQYDNIAYAVSNISDASQYVDRNKKFYIDVNTSAPAGTQILLQLETGDATPTNYPSGRHSRFVATTTQQNGWERLEFSLLDEPDGTASPTGIQSMILLFNSNSFTGDTYYFDNLDSYDPDTGSGSNQSPSVSISNPSDGATFTEGASITISANASDSDGSISQVEFFVDGNSIGTDGSQPYEANWTVSLGTSTITAVATDNEGASTTSSGVNVTGQSGGSASSMYVSSVIAGTAGAGRGSKYGTADVTILNNLGNPVSNASVSGTFSGTFSETANALTDANGVARFQTTASAKGGVTVNFCVDNVTEATLTYDPASNVMTCNNSGARTSAPDLTQIFIVPNPASDQIRVELEGFSNRVQIEIMDLKGNLVQKLEVFEPVFKLNIGELASGLYLLKAQDDQNNIQLSKLLK